MREMKNVRELLCRELDELGKKRDLTAGTLDEIYKLTTSIKNIDKIERMEAEGYSGGGNWEADLRGEYGRGNSYRRRDSMGRYTRTDAREHMRMQMEDMMRNADDEQTRDAIRRCMEQIERA